MLREQGKIAIGSQNRQMPALRDPPERSSLSSLHLVIVFEVVIDSTEKIQDAELLPPLFVLFESLRHCCLECPVTAELVGGFQDLGIDLQVTRHDPFYLTRKPDAAPAPTTTPRPA